LAWQKAAKSRILTNALGFFEMVKIHGKIQARVGRFVYLIITSDLIEKNQFSTTSPTKAE